MEGDKGIIEFMKRLLDDYKMLRGKKKDSSGQPFWDLVIITTADNEQREAFQLQINEKFERNELPTDLTIAVVPDPPGVRIGNGGSTLIALEFMDKMYGAEMYNKKTLLIHAGGWSQRMPSATILGKIFSLLPYGDPPYQMLDLKLALYWPFVDKIEAGVFLVCADDFLIYSFLSCNDWRMPSKGFTALAHPSPIAVGRTHGVYIIKDVEKLNSEVPVLINECLEVLQKPTDESMKLHGALLKAKGEMHEFAGGIKINGESVYTDSSYFFGTDIMQKLVNFKKSIGDLSCEIDAYGDFLQAVGRNATNSYIQQTSNVSQMTSNLIDMRQSVFDCLNGSDVHVLILNASVFIHIGTTTELLYHFCQDRNFQNQMSLDKDVFNTWVESQSRCIATPNVLPTLIRSVKDDNRISSGSCIMHSFINVESTIDNDCVVEFCDFPHPVHINKNCIISNCQLNWDKSTTCHLIPTIPSSAFMHTVPVTVDHMTQFVTVFFSVNDNLKKAVSSKDVETLPFMGSDIGHFLKTQTILKEDILPEYCQNSNDDTHDSLCSKNQQGAQIVKSDLVNLWSLKLYPAKSSMTASFEDAIQAMSSVAMNKTQKMSVSLFSLADLLLLKNVQTMLNFRRSLYDKILSYTKIKEQ